MSVIDNLITDRTDRDVQEWEQLRAKGLSGMTAEELSKWLSGMKGSYSPHIDMNRVGSAMQYVASWLQDLGSDIRVSPKTDWANGDVPSLADLNHYLEDLRTLRAAVSVLPTTPAVPSDLDGLTIQEANAIEKILVDLDALLVSMREVTLHAAQPFLFCGYAVYPSKEHLQVYTADGLPVDTADGKPVYAW